MTNQFQCPFCAKTSPAPQGLAAHVRTNHSKQYQKWLKNPSRIADAKRASEEVTGISPPSARKDVTAEKAAIRKQAEQLPAGDIYLISVANEQRGMTAGLVTSMPREIAARVLVEGTYVLATPEQTAAHLQDQTAKSRAIREQADPNLALTLLKQAHANLVGRKQSIEVDLARMTDLSRELGIIDAQVQAIENSLGMFQAGAYMAAQGTQGGAEEKPRIGTRMPILTATGF